MVTLLSVPFGWVGWELDQRRKENAVVAWIEEIGGQVGFTFYSPYPVFYREAYEYSWWERQTANWFGERVRYVDLWTTNVSDVSQLVELKKLKELWLDYSHVPDLTPLKELSNLEKLNLIITRPVTEEQVQELRLTLPNSEIEFIRN